MVVLFSTCLETGLVGLTAPTVSAAAAAVRHSWLLLPLLCYSAPPSVFAFFLARYLSRALITSASVGRSRFAGAAGFGASSSAPGAAAAAAAALPAVPLASAPSSPLLPPAGCGPSRPLAAAGSAPRWPGDDTPSRAPAAAAPEGGGGDSRSRGGGLSLRPRPASAASPLPARSGSVSSRGAAAAPAAAAAAVPRAGSAFPLRPPNRRRASDIHTCSTSICLRRKMNTSSSEEGKREAHPNASLRLSRLE